MTGWLGSAQKKKLGVGVQAVLSFRAVPRLIPSDNTRVVITILLNPVSEKLEYDGGFTLCFESSLVYNRRFWGLDYNTNFILVKRFFPRYYGPNSVLP